jgi:hypothetical protein
VQKGAGGDNVNIESEIRASGHTSSNSKLVASTEITKLLDELEEILKCLPTGSLSGSEDIYGLDIQIAWGSAQLEWCNDGSQGRGGGTSDVQPSKEDKANFKRAVEIARKIVES